MCRIFSDAVFCAMYCSAFVRRFQLNFNIFNKDELFHPHQCVLPVFLCHGHCSIELWQHNASPICVINEPKAWFEIFLPWPLVQCAPQTHLEVVIKDKMQDSMASIHGLIFPNKKAAVPVSADGSVALPLLLQCLFSMGTRELCLQGLF